MVALVGQQKILRFDWIDALRGLAILMVIMVHVGNYCVGLKSSVKNFTHFGTRGVLLFFIVSAFTLFRTASVRSIRFNARSFYIRRYCRIAPMFLLAMMFYAAWFRYHSLTLDDIGEVGVVSYLLLIPFLIGLSPYAYDSFVPGGWSVSAEFLFYYSLPLLRVICRGLRSTLLVLCLAFVLASAWSQIYEAQVEAYFLVHAGSPEMRGFVIAFGNFAFCYQLPVFICGMLLVYVDIDAIRRFGARSAFIAGVIRFWPYVAFMGLLTVAASGSGAVQSRTVSVAALFSLVFGFCLSPENLLVNRMSVLIGRYSYSIYLVHWIFLAYYADLTARVLPEDYPTLRALVSFALVTASSCVIAALTYCGIEKPFIQLGHKLSAPRQKYLSVGAPPVGELRPAIGAVHQPGGGGG